MTFLEPQRLWWLLLIVLVVGAYVFAQNQRREYTLRFTNLALLDQVAPHRPDIRRHVPAVLFVSSLAVLIASMAPVRERYRRAAADQRTAVRDALRRCGVHHLLLRTDRDWV
ncbi:BatA domain-containing protein, partial [Nocardiopsis tropica]|nr:BatA domain-containing protein [Nocardiopsis tropica]